MNCLYIRVINFMIVYPLLNYILALIQLLKRFYSTLSSRWKIPADNWPNHAHFLKFARSFNQGRIKRFCNRPSFHYLFLSCALLIIYVLISRQKKNTQKLNESVLRILYIMYELTLRILCDNKLQWSDALNRLVLGLFHHVKN